MRVDASIIIIHFIKRSAFLDFLEDLQFKMQILFLRVFEKKNTLGTCVLRGNLISKRMINTFFLIIFFIYGSVKTF